VALPSVWIVLRTSARSWSAAVLERIAAGFVAGVGEREDELLGCGREAADGVQDSYSVAGQGVAARPFELEDDVDAASQRV